MRSSDHQAPLMQLLGPRRTAIACSGLLVAMQFGPTALAETGQPHWNWPLAQPQVLRGFVQPEEDWSSGHRGLDLTADPGDRVSAIGAGVVAHVGVIGGKPFVSIDHPGTGLRSTYEPVVAIVKPGDQVTGLTTIGILASAGGHCSTGCLHLGVKRIDHEGRSTKNYLDPMSLLRRWAILKPVHRRPPADAPD